MVQRTAGIKVDEATQQLIEMNEAFWRQALDLVDWRFYAQLKERDCVVGECVLVDIFPDGDETFFGTVIRQDGRVFDFDLCLRDRYASEWCDRTDAFLEEIERLGKPKPWLPSVIAYRMFHEIAR